jgi:hypothetical protein
MVDEAESDFRGPCQQGESRGKDVTEAAAEEGIAGGPGGACGEGFVVAADIEVSIDARSA